MRPSLVVKFLFSLVKSSTNVHHIETGKSPFVTMHVAATVSSRLSSSSPKENGLI